MSTQPLCEECGKLAYPGLHHACGITVAPVKLKEVPAHGGELAVRAAVETPVLTGTIVRGDPAVRAAEDRKQRIMDAIQDLAILVTEAVEAGDWRTLGYPDLLAWCDDVISNKHVPKQIREQLVRALRDEGHSLRAIAVGLHVSKDTVQRDTASPVSNETPARITGIDGKDYPREQKQARREQAAEDAELDRQATERMAAEAAEPPVTAEEGCTECTLLNAARDTWDAVEVAAGRIGGVTVDEGRNSLDLNGWTVTIPARSRKRAAELKARLEEAADEFTTLAKMLDRALNAPKGRK